MKKNWDKFEIRIIDQKKYYSDISIEYMNLHVKDSGKVHRPIETFQAQLELINQGEGFAVQVIDKTIGVFLGMLIILHNKNSAYDFSVAVDPDYKNEYVSHLMKWKTIQHLQEIGIKYYELGLFVS